MVFAVLAFWSVIVLNKYGDILVGLIVEFRHSSVSPVWAMVVLSCRRFGCVAVFVGAVLELLLV